MEYSFQALFQRDQQGLEIERSLPGGIRSRWSRDKLGRPTKHDIFSGNKTQSSKTYIWGLNDRLLKLIDSMNRETVFQHDALGNLVSARYSDSSFELRMPDAVGNLFKTTQKNDREYGPAGQLLAVHSTKGTTRYEYDAEGNLVRKIEPNSKVWHYHWNGAGHMAKVIRPDGQEIRFEYDALGSRIQKIVGNKTTHWMWDGNNPLHEWVDYKPAATQPINAQNTRQQDANADKAAIASRNALSTVVDHQGPPNGKARFNEGTQAKPITWLFEPDSFTPMAKLVGDEHYSIITDHLGTPNSVFDKDGKPVWSADISVWGELRNLQGDRDFCPFRYPGQYEDSETGLYYNRFRYYDPEAGRYVSQDPISLVGGDRVYVYAHDCTTWVDPLGLSCKNDWNTFQRNTAGHFPSRAHAAASYRKMKAAQAMPKGTRHDPSTYLPQSYIDQHLAQFDQGATKLMTKSNFEKYGPAQRDGTSFVISKSEADALLSRTRGDKAKLEAALGLPPGQLATDELYRVDFENPRSLGLRIPSGNEAGANSQWLAGGKLPDGSSEAIIDVGDIDKYTLPFKKVT